MRLLNWLVPLALVAACTAGDKPAAAADSVAPVAAAAADGRPLDYALVGKAIPKFSAPMLGGGTLSDESFAGKWTVVEFWGLWCPDCMVDAPYTQALSRAIAQDPGLEFVTVHVSERYAKYSSIEAFFKEKGYSYPTALDADKSVYKAFELKWVPTYLVVGPDKVVRGFRTDLSKEENGAGGVKTFLQQVAEMKKAAKN